MFVLAAVYLIFLHGPGGQEIELNAAAISTLREPRNKEHFAPGTHCLVFTSNGKLVAVTETCAEIVRMVGEAERKRLTP